MQHYLALAQQIDIICYFQCPIHILFDEQKGDVAGG
jgi:hypothetical protein